jgi:hypothetical protein
VKKRTVYILGVLGLILFFSPEAIRVQAAGGCKPRGFGKVIAPLEHPFGFGFNVAQKTAPQNVIVWGQDEAKLGVNIRIELRSYPLTVKVTDYNKVECVQLSASEVEAIGRENLASCGGGKGYRLKAAGSGYDDLWCVPYSRDETVFRQIQQDTIKIWLNPSDITRQWLGWNNLKSPNGNYPLRFVYPESWTVNSWDSSGWIVEGDPLSIGGHDVLGSEGDSGFDYVKSEPTEYAIPSRTLRVAFDPISMQVYQERNPVLALYGSFSGFYSGTSGHPVEVPGSGACEFIFGETDVTGKGTAPQWESGSDVYPSCEKDGKTIWQTFFFNNIPLDLPGTWQIGILFFVAPATFEGQPIIGEVIPGEEDRLLPWDGNGNTTDIRYNMELHSFQSYIIMSVPCNDLEPGSCIE